MYSSSLDFVLFCSFVGFSTCSMNAEMIVFSGVVTDHSDCEAFSEAVDFTLCVVECGQREWCQLCYPSSSCVLCAKGNVTASPGSGKIAIKTTNDPQNSNFCPRGTMYLNYTKPPAGDLFEEDSQENESDEQNNFDYYNETKSILVQSDYLAADIEITRPMPTIRTDPAHKVKCPKGLSPCNNWCLRVVFTSENYHENIMTYEESLPRCADIVKNSTTITITGPEDESELEFLKSKAKQELSKSNNDVGIWLDGQLTTSCSDEKSCFPNNFEMIDKRIQNYAGYDWYEDSLKENKNSLEKKCIFFMAPNNNADLFGKVALTECDGGIDGSFRKIGIFCRSPPL